VSEAASALGITVDAVRSRVKRGTIAHEREGGRVYVLLDATEARPVHDQASGQGAGVAQDRTAELIATLREQLEAERQAHSEARRLLAAALERIPTAIEPPGASTEATEGVVHDHAPPDQEEGAERSGPPRGREEPTERPWWRFW